MYIQAIKAKLGDWTYTSGLLLIPVSLLIFCVPFFITVERNSFMPLFFFNFVLATAYFSVILFSGRLKKKGDGIHLFFLFLVLALISAYGLNREIAVFEQSAPWFAVLLALCCINYIAFAFWEIITYWCRCCMCFLLGVSLVCFLYLSVYLAPLYALSVIISFALGFSLHTFVPLLFFIYTIVLAGRMAVNKRGCRISFWAGVLTPTAILAGFCAWWGIVVGEMNSARERAAEGDTGRLPAWVAVAQHTPRNGVAERVLKGSLVYSVPEHWTADFFWRMPSRRFDEQRKHDPLVMTAALLCGQAELDDDERIRILESMYDSRHQAQERLWSGNDLRTEHIQTSVRIWPQLHIAYTEKLVTVASKAVPSGWRDGQEAIYTFHLPEGAVVSSLSLWVNGKEEPGILTTKAKADTAYKTIVGREARDPSVVHWQEGNTVTVRVFPVMAGHNRRFKIGITAPLPLERNRLVYRNIYFDGPAVSSTREDVTVAFDSQPEGLARPMLFKTEKDGRLTRQGRYHAGWELAFNNAEIAANAFGFNGNVYTIAPYTKERTATVFNTVYLDVNSAWTAQEFNSVYALLKEQMVLMYVDNRLERVTDQNKAALFQRLQAASFSLFPLFMINDPATSLLITKSTVTSPNLADLEGCTFRDSLQATLDRHLKVPLFNLGDDLSPYLRTLKECRAFRYEQGNVALLEELLSANSFSADIENDGRVVIDQAGITITGAAGACISNAPSHLQRLFAYNHIMQQLGPRLLKGVQEHDAQVTAAKEAHIVTPLSSLVVLETAEDYERFNIKDSENSLKNASLHANGAVPEPHEWALIIIAILALAYAGYRPAFLKRKPV